MTPVVFNSQVTNIDAGSFVVGIIYTMTGTGTTDFTLIGAANNDTGTTFTATGSGSGTRYCCPEMQYTEILVLPPTKFKLYKNMSDAQSFFYFRTLDQMIL